MARSCALGKFAEAEPLLREALAIWRKSLPPSDPSIAIALHDLALVLNDQGKYTEAEPAFQDAIASGQAALGKQDSQVGGFRVSHGKN